jgi:hypothetical protein
MNKSAPIASFLTCLGKILAVVCGFSFLVGGGLIHAETQMNRFNAELLGIGIAVIFGLLAFLANIIADRLTEEKDPLTITNRD